MGGGLSCLKADTVASPVQSNGQTGCLPKAPLKGPRKLSDAPPLPAGYAPGALLGLVKVTILSAELPKKGNYNITASMGLQSYLSRTVAKSKAPEFNEEQNFVILRHDPHVLHLLVHRLTSRLGSIRSQALGTASLDMLSFFDPEADPKTAQLFAAASADDEAVLFEGWAPLLHPSAAAMAILDEDPADPEGVLEDEAGHVGRIRIRVQKTSLEHLEAVFWKRMVTLVDWDESGTINKEEFNHLMHGLMSPSDISPDTMKALWEEAMQRSGNEGAPLEPVNGLVLAEVLTTSRRQGGFKLMQRCPVSGASLSTDEASVDSNLVYMLLQMDGGIGRNLQGGFRTAAQANRSWMMQMSEWATSPLAGDLSALWKGSSYEPGLNVGANAAHVVVYDRYKTILEEELISPVVVLAMRNMYQSTMGHLMKKTGMFRYLKGMSQARGRLMDDPASVADIPKFCKAYEGQIRLEDIEGDIAQFRTFNEFFYRKLRPGARQVAYVDNGDVLVSAADCRIMAFASVQDSQQFWIKGKRFSVGGMLADAALGERYEGGAMLIFRLAPQDYHRFHSPVNGTVTSIVPVEGQLYSVNPIVVNSTLCDVFTENKRVLVAIESPEFGLVQFVCVGATLVGSINLTVQVGMAVRKGDELGYFAFGGSTCIAMFEPGRVELDSDLQRMSSKSIETFVLMGDHVATTARARTQVEQTELPADVSEKATQLMQSWQQTILLARGGTSSMTVALEGPEAKTIEHTGSRLWEKLRKNALEDQLFLQALSNDGAGTPDVQTHSSST